MKRVLTAIVLGALAVYTVLAAHPVLFLIVLAAFAIVSFYEYTKLAEAHGYDARGPVGYAAGLVLLVTRRSDLLLVTLAGLIGLVLSLRSADFSKVLPRASALVLGLAYTFGAWKCAMLLREINAHWLLYALVLNWVADTAAFLAGKAFGRHKLAPRLSPGKTWEGAIAGVAGAAVFGLIYLGRYIPEISPLEALAVTSLATIAGQFGDLAESALKRGANVKDSGNLLPGHGGLLDRVDSTLFTLPLVYLWVAKPW
jgi:phosphatidate cytidylyltransferase